MFTHVLKVVLATVVAVSLIACNTIRRAGKDIERSGEAIQRSTQ